MLSLIGINIRPDISTSFRFPAVWNACARNWSVGNRAEMQRYITSIAQIITISSHIPNLIRKPKKWHY